MIWTPRRMKNKTCQRVEELLVRQRPSISSAQLCVRTSSCSWVTSNEEGGGKICTPTLQVGAWNVLSLREDDHLSQLSYVFKRFDSGIAALSEVRRPARSWWVVTPTIGLVALMVTKPKELL